MLTDDIPTERFVLACLAVDDVSESYLAWMADPEVNRYLESRHHEYDLASLRSYVTQMRESPDSYLFGIFARDGRRHLGNIKLGPVDRANGTAWVGLVIGERDVWGTGVATEAIGALTRWALGPLGLAKLMAGAYASNAGSSKAFQKVGYRIEGRQVSQVSLDDGSRDDVVLVGAVPADLA